MPPEIGPAAVSARFDRSWLVEGVVGGQLARGDGRRLDRAGRRAADAQSRSRRRLAACGLTTVSVSVRPLIDAEPPSPQNDPASLTRW